MPKKTGRTGTARKRKTTAGSSASRPRTSGVAKKTARSPEFQPPPNDHLSPSFNRLGLVPKAFVGTDEFLDVVTWNIRFFHDEDRDRVDRIVDVLSGLNADIIVLQEIRNESLEIVASELKRIEAGYYATAYGTTGGDQRVAIMYDLDWIRAKDDIHELFEKGKIIASDGKDAFPRLPLWGHFTGLGPEDPFDFQLVGVHLKSQRGGGDEQRARAAHELASWLTDDAEDVDADVIVLGDWNEAPNAKAWAPIRTLERQGSLLFSAINNPSDISHLMYKNKNNLGSRLDLTSISMSASRFMGKPPQVVRWAPLDEFLEGNPQANAIKAFLRDIREDVSDHLPVVTRFYFKPGE